MPRHLRLPTPAYLQNLTPAYWHAYTPTHLRTYKPAYPDARMAAHGPAVPRIVAASLESRGASPGPRRARSAARSARPRGAMASPAPTGTGGNGAIRRLLSRARLTRSRFFIAWTPLSAPDSTLTSTQVLAPVRRQGGAKGGARCTIARSRRGRARRLGARVARLPEDGK